MLSENDVARIAGSIARQFAPVAVGVFGSYAMGTAGERSDLDLFLICRGGVLPNSLRRSVKRVLHSVLHRLDVQVFTAAEFEESAREALSFAWVIVRQERLYHWTDEAKALVPSLFGHGGRP